MIDRLLAWSPQTLRWLVLGFLVFFWGVCSVAIQHFW
jgi:hypothetical protein